MEAAKLEDEKEQAKQEKERVLLFEKYAREREEVRTKGVSYN